MSRQPWCIAVVKDRGVECGQPLSASSDSYCMAHELQVGITICVKCGNSRASVERNGFCAECQIPRDNTFMRCGGKSYRGTEVVVIDGDYGEVRLRPSTTWESFWLTYHEPCRGLKYTLPRRFRGILRKWRKK